MIRLTRSQVQPIGLDLGADSVKMLQLEVMEQQQSLSVVAAARQALPDEARGQQTPLEVRLAVSMDIVRQLMRNTPFRGRSIVTCLPREIVHVKNLRLPMMPPAEVESAVQFEARNIFPFDTDQAMVRHLPAGEVRQGSDTRLEVIAVAVKEQDVNNFVEQLHTCGCVIESLDIEPGALYRGVERFIRRREDESEVHVLVDIGARRSQVVIGKGREISFYKPVEIGATHLHDAVARKLEITLEEARALRRRLIDSGSSAQDSATPDAVRQAVHDATRGTIEELAKEISLCLRYYSVTFRGHRPAKVRILGGEAADPHLLTILGEALPISVEAGQPLLSVNTAPMTQADRRGYMGEWGVAFGLGLKMTHGYFGARDGKRRDPASLGHPRGPGAAATASGGVEVIDIAQQSNSATQEGAHA